MSISRERRSYPMKGWMNFVDRHTILPRPKYLASSLQAIGPDHGDASVAAANKAVVEAAKRSQTAPLELLKRAGAID